MGTHLGDDEKPEQEADDGDAKREVHLATAEEVGELVHQPRHHRLKHGKLTVQAQREEHEEEENGPELRDRQQGHRFRVGHERQAWTCRTRKRGQIQKSE